MNMHRPEFEFTPSSAGLGRRGEPDRRRVSRDQAPRDQAPIGYGVSCVIRVYQLASVVRVPVPFTTQAPNGALIYVENVQVWPMYSEAIHTELPRVNVAP